MVLKTIIVEDEVMARKSLENLCDRTESLEVVGSFSSAEESLAFIQQENVELILLDIEMPGISGLQLLEKIPYLPQVIFTTGNKDYAYEAYEYDITDFLKKPVSADRFGKAIQKAVELQQKRYATATESAKYEFYIKSKGRYVRLAYESILYFENVGDYIKVVTEEGSHLIHSTLKAIDAKITNPRFLKVHRSYIINLNKIKDIEDNTIVIAKKVIPVSRAYKSLLMGSINLL